MLAAPHAGVYPAGSKQLGVRSLLYQMSAAEHQGLVRMRHGSQTVSDDYHRMVPCQPIDHAADRALALHIDVRGSLVKDVDGRIMQQGAGHANALALAAGKVGAAFRQLHIEPAVCAHKPSDAAPLENVHKVPVRRIRARQQQIGPQRSCEQMARRGHQRHRAHQRVECGVAHVHAAYFNLSQVRSLATGQNTRQSRLARTALAHNRHQAAAAHRAIHLIKHHMFAAGTALAVGVTHATAHDVAATVQLALASPYRLSPLPRPAAPSLSILKPRL